MGFWRGLSSQLPGFALCVSCRGHGFLGFFSPTVWLHGLWALAHSGRLLYLTQGPYDLSVALGGHGAYQSAGSMLQFLQV